MQLRVKNIIGILSIGAILAMIISCQLRQKQLDESAISEQPFSARFDQPDVPFTFSYPPSFFNDASRDFRLRQGKNGPGAGPQEHSLRIDEHNQASRLTRVFE